MSENEISVATTPATLLEMAVNQNADIEKLEKLMDLQQRWEEREAKKAYHAAMAAFKAEPLYIGKDMHVSYSTTKGQTDYRHSSLANVTNTINRALSAQGLSASWQQAQADGAITVTCTITHVGGYSESTSLSAAPDTSGGKNSIQAIGSTVSYLERYTILAITGQASSDMDDDGRGAEIEYIAEDQVNEIEAAIKDNSLNRSIFLGWVGAESIEKIQIDQLGRVKNGLAAAIKKRAGK